MRSTMLAVLALSAAITTQAKADYVWQFVPTKVTALDIDYSGGFGYTPDPTVSHKEAKSWLPKFDLTITDAAFKSRSLSLSWSGCFHPGMMCDSGPTGDFSKLVSFSDFYTGSTDRLYGYGMIDLAWNKRGKMAGGMELYGMLSDLTLTGSGNQWTGLYGSDNSECGMQVARCGIDGGHFAFLGDPPTGETSAPEPASIAMLIAGLAGLAFVQQKRRRDYSRHLGER